MTSTVSDAYAKYQRRYQQMHKEDCARKARRHYVKHADKIRRKRLLHAINTACRSPKLSTVERYGLVYDCYLGKWT